MKKIIIGAIVLVFIYLLTYTLYLKELYLISDIREQMAIELCNEYYDSYPRGHYIDEVNYIEIQITKDIIKIKNFIETYRDSKFFEDVSYLEIEAEPDFHKVVNFMEKYPESKYHDKVQILKTKLWQMEIDKYIIKVSNIKLNEKKKVELTNFLSELLYYLRDNDIHKIRFILNGQIELKELDEYNNYYIEQLGKMMIKLGEPELRGNLLPFKQNFDQGNVSELENLLISSVIQSFDNSFCKGFIEFDNNRSQSILQNLPILSIQYRIINQEEKSNKIVVPVIWDYYEMDGTSKQFISYILGVSIYFEFKFSLPNNKQFIFQEIAQPNEFINNIQNVNEGYKEMTKMAFQNYAIKMIEMMGLND